MAQLRRRLPDLPLWSERWSREALLKKQAAGRRSFSRGFQLRAFTDEERMFPSFRKCFQSELILSDVLKRGLPIYSGVDLSSDKRPGTCIFSTAYDKASRRRFPVDIQLGRWTSPQTAARLAALDERLHPRLIMVESNSYQVSLIDWIRTSCTGSKLWTKIEPYTTTGASKHHEVYGMPSLEIEFDHAMWAIPSREWEGHPPDCECGWCAWRNQMEDYPNGVADDTCMACLFAREAIEKWGGRASAGVIDLGDFNAR